MKIFQIIALTSLTFAGCVTSSVSTIPSPPLITEATFENRQSIMKNIAPHDLRAYVERHREADPLIYWALQIELNDNLWDGFRHNRDDEKETMRAYEEFFKAYKARHLIHDAKQE